MYTTTPVVKWLAQLKDIPNSDTQNQHHDGLLNYVGPEQFL